MALLACLIYYSQCMKLPQVTVILVAIGVDTAFTWEKRIKHNCCVLLFKLLDTALYLAQDSVNKVCDDDQSLSNHQNKSDSLDIKVDLISRQFCLFAMQFISFAMQFINNSPLTLLI